VQHARSSSPTAHLDQAAGGSGSPKRGCSAHSGRAGWRLSGRGQKAAARLLAEDNTPSRLNASATIDKVTIGGVTSMPRRRRACGDARRAAAAAPERTNAGAPARSHIYYYKCVLKQTGSMVIGEEKQVYIGKVVKKESSFSRL
jgi:hypothetical protein